jgi:hypothetical protein
MADWEYKEDSWSRPVKPRMNQTTKIDSDDKTTYAFLEEGGLAFHLGKDGYPVRLQFNRLDGQKEEQFGKRPSRVTNFEKQHKKSVVPLEEAERQFAEWESKIIPDFTTWLGHHSKEGWEIFKISRIFNSSNEDTWCIFRRKI